MRTVDTGNRPLVSTFTTFSLLLVENEISVIFYKRSPEFPQNKQIRGSFLNYFVNMKKNIIITNQKNLYKVVVILKKTSAPISFKVELLLQLIELLLHINMYS